MDDRIHRHAEILVEQCTDVGPEDNVIIGASPAAEDLVVALYRKLGEVGARPALHWNNARAGREYARAMDSEDYRTAEHRLAEMEETDVAILVGGSTNMSETSDVDPDINVAASKAHEPVFKERLDKRWVITQHPAPGSAQKAEMPTDAYADFVWNAVDKDWDAQREFQQGMADILDEGEEVRIVSGDTTDITMSIAGMRGCNDWGGIDEATGWGGNNMPAGEVFTAPVPDSVEGEVLFDKPLMKSGREISDVYLRFEEGEVVEFDAAAHVDVLEASLDTDEGARRLGELGIGMNRDIDRFTYNMLFDEKMGDTVHMATGDAIDQCVPDGVEVNESATHVDMIVDMSEDSYIKVDGDVVQRNGTFRFEDGFE
jgi:aminopeptidase